MGQQAEESKAHEQPVGRRTGNMTEGHTEGISVWRRQFIDGSQVGKAELLGSSERQFPLDFAADGVEHVESFRRVNRISQQGGLAYSGIPVKHDRAAVPGSRLAKDAIEYPALVSSPEQHGWTLLWADPGQAQMVQGYDTEIPSARGPPSSLPLLSEDK